ncbi:MAG: transposase [Comamonadaceae bacterium]|nr:transposase [Comamonadaceae bacterium]
MVYLGRYLYRGVIQERDILRCDDTGVTYRWRHSKTGQMQQRCVSGAEFLRLVLQHVLPKGFRRARSCGFLHPNAKRMAALLRLLVFRTPAQRPEPEQRSGDALCLLWRDHAHREAAHAGKVRVRGLTADADATIEIPEATRARKPERPRHARYCPVSTR